MEELFVRMKMRWPIIVAHAGNRLDERHIPDWQIVAGVREGKLLRERPRARPNAVVEVEQVLPDGEVVKAAWAWLPFHQAAKLVAVHYLDD